MNKTTSLYFDERCLWHSAGEHVLTMPVGGWIQPMAGSGHPESPESKRRIKALMDVSGLTAQLRVSSAEPASLDDILRVHDRAYIQKLQEMSNARGGLAGPGAPFGHGSFEIAALSAGLAKRAIDDLLTGQTKNAFSLGRPPGHHCLPNQGMGFCMLANIAIAIEAAKANHGLGKVAVVDWDVHHGNGTQAIFYDRADVLTISLHQENCFPADSGPVSDRGTGDGEGYNLNIPLLPGSGHDAYIYAMQKIVVPALQAFQPDLIVVASGLDANGYDPLARMQLHSNSYRQMTSILLAVAHKLCEDRFLVVHEGGYSESYVPFCGLAIAEELAAVRTEVQDPFLGAIESSQPTARFAAFQRQLVDEIADLLVADLL